MRRFQALLILAIAVAGCSCNGDPEPKDAGIVDADSGHGLPDGDVGVDADATMEPDRDNDGVSDSLDNCPDLMNVDQANEDGDAFGDACDSCPATSTTLPCSSVQEMEPNNVLANGQPLELPEIGEVVEVLGTIETSTRVNEPIDRFLYRMPVEGLMRPVLLHVRLSGRGPSSTLEPALEAEWLVREFSFPDTTPTYPRRADGALVAERDLLFYVPSHAFPSGFVYELRVGDRRAWFNGAPLNADFDYVLSIEQRPYESIVENVGEFSGSPGSFSRMFTVEPRGAIKVVRVTLIDDRPQGHGGMRAELETARGTGQSTAGLDTILMIGVRKEYDNWRADSTDSKSVYFDDLGARSTWNIDVLIDHRNIVGDDLDATLTLKFADELEREPNNSPTEAQTLLSGQQLSGRMTAPAPDEDWIKFWSWGGEIWYVRCENPRPNNMPFSDIKLDLFKDGSPAPQLIHSNLDASQLIDPVMAYLIPDPGDYYFRVTSEAPSDVWDPGAPMYDCYFQAYALDNFPVVAAISSSTIVTGTFESTTRLGHDIERFDVNISARSRLDVMTSMMAPGIAPYFRVYGPGGFGLLAEGSLSVGVDLEPSPNPYVLIVQNGNDGLPDTSGNPFSFELNVTMTPR